MENKKNSQGKTNRMKGHTAERYYMRIFKELGFDKCVTSRHGSHLADSAKIDLIFIPINLQIKAGYKSLNYSVVLGDMSKAIKEIFPAYTPEYNNPNVMVHHKNVGAGYTRDEHHSIVGMTHETLAMFTKKVGKAFIRKLLISEKNGVATMTWNTFIVIFKEVYLKNEKTK